MSQKKKDFSAIKFLVAEAMGEWMNVLYIKWDSRAQRLGDFIHHTDSDGTSAMTKILEKEGHLVHEVPLVRSLDKLSFIARFKLFLNFLKLTKAIDLKWKKPRLDITGVPESFFVTRFSLEQTKAMGERAKSQGASLNSYLLWALDKTVSDNLLAKGSERKWVSPINMRVDQKQRYGNNSASIIINITDDEAQGVSPKDVHAKIKNYLVHKLNWGSQIYSNIARFVGFKGTLYLAKKVKEVGTGVFRNMGDWPTPDIEISPQASTIEHRIYIAPATQVLPVAAATYAWNGQLSLSIQFHPSLALTRAQAQEVADKWTQALGSAPDQNWEEIQWNEYAEAPEHLIKQYLNS